MSAAEQDLQRLSRGEMLFEYYPLTAELQNELENAAKKQNMYGKTSDDE